VRLSCFADPLNRKKEKVVNMHISRFEAAADMSLYSKDKILTRGIHGWKLKPPYLGYELINLP
jgi:hypothetical protein